MKRWALFFLCVTLALGFAALSVWQWERRSWKLDLIARVDARIHAAPVAMPSPQKWPSIDAHDEYRRIRLRGHFMFSRETLVDALTDRGAGAWVLTPLVTPQGVVLVNRGFVPAEQNGRRDRPGGEVAVVGLLRLSEPKGRFLRPNQPQHERWYSRDVTGIAAARHLGAVAPFFVDAELSEKPGYPIAGLTVVQFRNMHLFYAMTWLALAAMSAFGAWLAIRSER